MIAFLSHGMKTFTLVLRQENDWDDQETIESQFFRFIKEIHGNLPVRVESKFIHFCDSSSLSLRYLRFQVTGYSCFFHGFLYNFAVLNQI